MKPDMTVYQNQKVLRCGYTTGSCAAAAAKAALFMILTGEDIREVKLMTPKGVELFLEVLNCTRGENHVCCAIRKDSGDDPDVTDQILVYADVSKSAQPGISITGGIGVGRVTKKGLWQEIGEAAINPVPMEMIRTEAEKLCGQYRYEGGVEILISMPQGEEAAKKTFNGRLGIVGGLSVLGTTGIVEPMSEKALTDTIRLELHMRREQGAKYICAVPGNYGSDFLQEELHYDSRQAVQCSNYVGETIDDVIQLGYEGLLLVGHVGKFIKLAAGIMNTHSRQADARMEIIAAHAALAGATKEQVQEIMEAVTTKEALSILQMHGLKERVMKRVMERIDAHIAHRTGGQIKVGVILFSQEEGILGKTKWAEELLQRLQQAEVEE